MNIQAVVFDVDGTLYSNAAMYRRSMWFGLRNLRFILGMSKIRKQIREMDYIEDFFTVQADLLANRLGMSREKARTYISERVCSWEDELKGIPLMPGLHDFLDHLTAAGIRTGLLSDFPVQRKLKIIGMDRDWDCILSSEDVGYLKPRIESFTEVCKRLNLPPDHILYVGNSYSYDVIGAKNTGMLAAHVAAKPVSGTKADVTIADYYQLDTWLFDRDD